MATDATGTPTSPDSIPKYNTAVDAPSGKGFNAAMDAVQVGLSARASKPASIASGEVPVWNGTTWVRSTTTNIGPTSLGSGSPSSTNYLRGDGTWAAAISTDGWTALSALTYGTTDGHTFTATYSGDLTASVPVGARIKLTNQSATQYFIVTVHVAGTLTLYGGLNYSITNTSITNPFFSREKVPVGFPIRKDAWTEILADSTPRNQASPAASTFYNVGSLFIDIPIGDWAVTCEFTLGATWGITGLCGVLGGLGTSASAVPDPFLYGAFAHNSAFTGAAAVMHQNVYRSVESLVLGTKTRYYVTVGCDTAILSNIGVCTGSFATYTKIQAVCNYL